MEATREYPSMPASVPPARHFVRDTLVAAGRDDSEIDKATLLTSELVTSAVLHSHSGFKVRVIVDGHVRVEVTDHLPSLPAAPDRSGEPKLSLYLLDAIADQWGWDAVAEGKTVWCEVR